MSQQRKRNETSVQEAAERLTSSETSVVLSSLGKIDRLLHEPRPRFLSDVTPILNAVQFSAICEVLRIPNSEIQARAMGIVENHILDAYKLCTAILSAWNSLSPELRPRALHLIEQCGVDAASLAIDRVVKCLSDSDSETRRCASEFLLRNVDEFRPALTDLFTVFETTEHGAVRNSACRAIIRLLRQVHDSRTCAKRLVAELDRDNLLKCLLEVGEEGREIRRLILSGINFDESHDDGWTVPMTKTEAGALLRLGSHKGGKKNEREAAGKYMERLVGEQPDWCEHVVGTLYTFKKSLFPHVYGRNSS
jgi:hypothetical protein